MKKLLFVWIILFFASLCPGQGRIEILVNGEIQRLSREPIRIKNKTDQIELRIYFQNLRDRISLIDSIKTLGCGIKTKESDKMILRAPNQQQKQILSSTRPIEKKFEITGTIKPVRQNGYISFSSIVSDITVCQGRNFSFELIFNQKISPIVNYTNFSKVYNFYFVL